VRRTRTYSKRDFPRARVRRGRATHEWHRFLGAVILLANWPYTTVVIMRTNRRLMETAPEAAMDETGSMIRQWGILHAGRSALGLVATPIYLWPER
jgi:hypothetical protein